MSFKRVINCVETHSGEPMRVVTGGVAPLKGNSVYEQMVYLREHDDALRKFLLREPRGYPPLCCGTGRYASETFFGHWKEFLPCHSLLSMLLMRPKHSVRIRTASSRAA